MNYLSVLRCSTHREKESKNLAKKTIITSFFVLSAISFTALFRLSCVGGLVDVASSTLSTRD